MTENDIVKDILDRIAEIMGPAFTGEIYLKIENDIRSYCSGEKYYISGKMAEKKRKSESRIESIRRLWKDEGLSKKELSQRFKVSLRTIDRATQDIERHRLP